MTGNNEVTNMIASEEAGRTPSPQAEMSDENKSKDVFFVRLAELAEAMIAAHGKDFVIGALVLSAKFVAEGKPLIKRADGSDTSAGVEKPN